MIEVQNIRLAKQGNRNYHQKNINTLLADLLASLLSLISSSSNQHSSQPAQQLLSQAASSFPPNSLISNQVPQALFKMKSIFFALLALASTALTTPILTSEETKLASRQLESQADILDNLLSVIQTHTANISSSTPFSNPLLNTLSTLTNLTRYGK